MKIRLLYLLFACVLVSSVASGIAAEPAAETKEAPPKASTLGALFGGRAMPSLSGLIKPEKMGLLTDNQIQGNAPHLLSDNEAEIASENEMFSSNLIASPIQLQLLSGFKLFSDLVNIDVNINVSNSGNEGVAAPNVASKAKGKKKSRKGGKKKAGRKRRPQASPSE